MMFIRLLLFAFASVPFPLNNKNNFENIESTTKTDNEKPEFIYGKEENISINKIHLNFIRKRVLEYLQKENYSEIQKIMVIERYMKA